KNMRERETFFKFQARSGVFPRLMLFFSSLPPPRPFEEVGEAWILSKSKYLREQRFTIKQE
ncbi:hypothetical protein CH063_15013, partial [Colletotrichum higginsianum]